MPEPRTTSESAPPRPDRPLRQILLFLCFTYAIAVSIALALPHADITPLLSIAAPVLGFAITMLVRKGADFDKARPRAQRPTIEPRVEARQGQ
jgi:hypothetical protein